MRIEEYHGSLYVSGIEGIEKPLKFPSQMYPMTGSPVLLHAGNTADFPICFRTEQVRRVFDSIASEMGMCYSNTERLISDLHSAGFRNVQPFVGWQFIGDTPPVLHCFAIMENHVLDLATNFGKLEKYCDPEGNQEQIRNQIVEAVVQMQHLPNSEKYTFGRLPDDVIIIAAFCKPSEGRKMHQKLLKTYPRHPCFHSTKGGTTELQRRISDRLKSQ